MAQPVRLTPESKAVLPFISTDSTRPALQNVLVKADGRLVAADGKKLIILEQKNALDLDEYPCGQFTPQREPLVADIMLPADGVAQVIKAIPKPMKGGACPVLHNAVQVANGNGHVTMGVTDLDTAQTFDLRQAEGQYPDYGKVLPTEPPTVQIRLMIADLAAMVSACKAIGATSLKVSITSPMKPFMAEAEGQKANALMLAMPAHL